jgi:hypothetical protein
MQVTTETDFQLGIATPNLIHDFFTIAVQIPAITRFEAIPPEHERHRRFTEPPVFGSVHCAAFSARSLDRSV